MNYCEVHVGNEPANCPEDPRYEPCGKPACIKEGDTWLCAEHYDKDATRVRQSDWDGEL